MFESIERSEKFGRVHHRFLNDIEDLRALISHCAQPSEFSEIAEGDVCWLEEGGKFTFFMLHPPPPNRLPSVDQIKQQLSDGTIPTLDRILDEDLSNLLLIVEIKSGIGNTRRALTALIELLEERVSGRYCIDSFSPFILKFIKTVSASAATSLHTRLGVYGRLVWKTAFEVPPVLPMSVYGLDWADAITVTYKYSPARYLGRFLSIDAVHKHVQRAGKRLVFGGVETPEVFENVQRSLAIAAYPKFTKAAFATPYGS